MAAVNQQVFDLFMNSVKKHDTVCNHLKECLEAAQHYASLIRRARVSGNTCRKQAVWIGLERSSTFFGFGLI